MTSNVRSFPRASFALQRTTRPPPKSIRRNQLERGETTGNRRRNRLASSSSSPELSEAKNNEKNENEEKTNETTATSTKTSRVVDFVAAWDVLSERLAESSILRSEMDESDDVASSNSPSREMLLAALALAIPKLQRMPHIVLDDFNRRREFRAKNRKEKDDALNGRCPRERAVAMCTQLIDLGMDAECCSAGLLRDASLANEISLETIEQQLGSGVVRVAHDCQRLRDLPERLRNNNNNNNNAFAVLNEELRRDVLIASVSNADHLSETLEQAHKIATETDDAGETILKSLSQQKNRLLSARAAATSMERDMESSERKLRRMGYEKCVQKWMWHVVALCFIGALGTFVYFKITNPDAHHKNGHRLSDYKILDEDEDTGKFV